MISLRRKRRAWKGSSGSKQGLTVSKTKSTASLSERQIESEILLKLNQLPNTYAWKNHSMGVYDPMRNTFRRLSGFAIKGVSDILGIHQGKMLCLEVKSEKGRVRPEQRAFLDRMSSLGAICGVVRSWQDAQDALQGSRPDNPDTSVL